MAHNEAIATATEQLVALARERKQRFYFRHRGDEFILFMLWQDATASAQEFCDTLVDDLS